MPKQLTVCKTCKRFFGWSTDLNLMSYNDFSTNSEFNFCYKHHDIIRDMKI